MHVAVIPDGNRRWACSKKLAPFAGHKAGAGALEKIIRSIILAKEIEWFTFWAASVDNFKKRSQQELFMLNRLFARQFNRLAKYPEIHEYRIRVLVIGKWRDFLDAKAKKAVEAAMKATASYRNQTITFLIAYDGKQEMLLTIKKIVEVSRQAPEICITSELLKYNLMTSELPPVDLLIRTGGDPHLSSGFLMWGTADAQLFFCEKLWPDFTPEDLEIAIMDYKARERRFGA